MNYYSPSEGFQNVQISHRLLAIIRDKRRNQVAISQTKWNTLTQDISDNHCQKSMINKVIM